MSSKQFTQTVARAHAIKQQIKALEDEYDTLLDSLGTLDPRNYPAGDLILQVTPTIRFNEAEAKRNLSPEKFQSILKQKPDATLARKVLGDEFSLCQKTYGVTRKIVRVEDMEDD